MPYVTSVERLATQRGLQQGLQEGLQQGRLEGKREGRLEGKREGETEKAATLLERLLVKRFGPLDEATRQRLAMATLEQLDRWADRILDVPRIEAVFEEH